jgi:hypothetical protein
MNPTVYVKLRQKRHHDSLQAFAVVQVRSPGYSAVSMGDRRPTFRDRVVVSSSRATQRQIPDEMRPQLHGITFQKIVIFSRDTRIKTNVNDKLPINQMTILT